MGKFVAFPNMKNHTNRMNHAVPKGVGAVIECKICHKEFNVLTTHLQKAHKMPKKVYSTLYNTKEFISPEAKAEMQAKQESHRLDRSDYAKQQWADGTLKGKTK